jgi:hypothetical protein
MFRVPAPARVFSSPPVTRVGSCSAGLFEGPPSFLAKLECMKAQAFGRRMMEHRWGRRIETRLPLALQSTHNVRALGTLLNASLSGAYVATKAAVKRDQRVTLQLRSPIWLNLGGFVVRIDEAGVGLEWELFASDSVRALLLSVGRREPRHPRLAPNL